MGRLIGKFASGTGGETEAIELIRDVSNDVPLLDAPGGLLRLPNGRGWRVWCDTSGALCVSEYGPAECDDIIASVEQDAAELRANEEQLREQSRQMRELAAPSIRAAR